MLEAPTHRLAQVVAVGPGRAHRVDPLLLSLALLLVVRELLLQALVDLGLDGQGAEGGGGVGHLE
jgi:hypothetical protein